MKKKSKVSLFQWLAVLWSIIIFTLSVLPSSSFKIDQADKIPHLDKIAHFIMYMVFVFLWILACIPYKNRQKILGFSLLGGILFGIFIEILQNLFFTSRDFEILDILANIGGSLVGIVIFLTFENSFYNLISKFNKRSFTK